MTGIERTIQTNSVPGRALPGQNVNLVGSLYRAEAGYVLHSLRRLGVEDRDVEDVAHDTFLVVARKLDDYDNERPLRPWLFGIAFRVALDYRRSARVRRVQLDLPPETEDVVTDYQSPDARIDAQRIVLAALQTLRLEARAVLILHDIDEVPVPEIATSLHIPLNTAYSRLRLARAQFEAAVRVLSRGEG